jgi:hypothetical protein
MTTIRNNLMNWHTNLGDANFAPQLMAAALLLLGTLLTLAGLAQQQPLMLGLGAIGLIGAFKLRAPRRDPA